MRIEIYYLRCDFFIILLLVELDRHIRYSYFIILFAAWYKSLAPYNPASLIALWCTFITHIQRIKEVKINSRNVQKLLSKYIRWYGNLNIPNIQFKAHGFYLIIDSMIFVSFYGIVTVKCCMIIHVKRWFQSAWLNWWLFLANSDIHKPILSFIHAAKSTIERQMNTNRMLHTQYQINIELTWYVLWGG